MTARCASGMWRAAAGWRNLDGHAGVCLVGGRSARMGRRSSRAVRTARCASGMWPVASSVAQLDGHAGSVLSVGFSPDGAQIVSRGDDGTVRIWDVASGSRWPSSTGHARVGSVLRRSARMGRRSSSAGDDGTVRIWDVASGGRPCATRRPPGRVLSAAFSPDGQQIVSARCRRHGAHLGCGERQQPCATSRATRGLSGRRRSARMGRRSSAPVTTARCASGMWPAAQAVRSLDGPRGVCPVCGVQPGWGADRQRAVTTARCASGMWRPVSRAQLRGPHGVCPVCGVQPGWEADRQRRCRRHGAHLGCGEWRSTCAASTGHKGSVLSAAYSPDGTADRQRRCRRHGAHLGCG